MNTKHTHEEGSEQESHHGIGLGVMAAVAAAGATYFLFGTDKGAEARKKMGKVASDAKDSIGDMKDMAMDKASDMKDKAVDMASGALEGGNELMNAGKEAFADMTHLFKEHYAELKKLDEKELHKLGMKLKQRWEDMGSDIEKALSKTHHKK